MIRAIRFKDRHAFRCQKQAGSVFFELTCDPIAFWFFCPCGCGDQARIPVGKDAKPACAPSWAWTGSLNDPTLSPSVRQLNCGWHGWLRDGYWEAC